MMERVRCTKMSGAEYAALDTKDPAVLYFVDSDEQSMGEAKVYIGGKLIGIDPSVLDSVATWNGTVLALGGPSSTTSHAEEVSLADCPGASFFELNLHATLRNPGQSSVNVEVWMERGYYEKVENEGKIDFVWHTGEHVAATQVFMAGRANAVCCASIAGQLIGPYPSNPCQYVRVCFSATSPIDICSATPQNNLPKATALTIRCWTPVTVA